jgi:hypothetical protein
MPFDLSRRLARLPRWLRWGLAAAVGLVGTALAVALLAVVAEGLDRFQPFGPGWQVASACLFGVLTLVAGVLGTSPPNAIWTGSATGCRRLGTSSAITILPICSVNRSA